MGTHNRLLRLGERSYLELIAVNPGSDKPQRPRWFGLDDRLVNTRLQTPRLLTWAARCENLASGVSNADYRPGNVMAMSRNSLNWLITIRDDGGLSHGGVLPALIDWLDTPHPAPGMPERGIALKTLEIGSPEPSRVEKALRSIGFDHGSIDLRVVLDESGPWLKTCLTTMRGIIRFDSRGSCEDGIFAA